MPIYKVGNIKKDDLQKYQIKVNYKDDSGNYRQLCRIAYGQEEAKLLEMKLLSDIKTKNEAIIRKMTVKQLFQERLSSTTIRDKKDLTGKIQQDIPQLYC